MAKSSGQGGRARATVLAVQCPASIRRPGGKEGHQAHQELRLGNRPLRGETRSSPLLRVLQSRHGNSSSIVNISGFVTRETVLEKPRASTALRGRRCLAVSPSMPGPHPTWRRRGQVIRPNPQLQARTSAGLGVDRFALGTCELSSTWEVEWARRHSFLRVGPRLDWHHVLLRCVKRSFAGNLDYSLDPDGVARVQSPVPFARPLVFVPQDWSRDAAMA